MKDPRKQNIRKMRLWLSLVFLSFTMVGFSQFSLASKTDFKIGNAAPNQFSLKTKILNFNAPQNLLISSKDSCIPGWGFMCVFEEQLTKGAKTPIRLRLGSVDYVDRLEGKN